MKPSMKKLRGQMRERRVFNAYAFYCDHVYIYNRLDEGFRSRAWVVVKRGPMFSQISIPLTEDERIFHYYGIADKASVLINAQEWASQQFGITTWAKDPFGGYGDAAFIAARIKELATPVTTNAV